jgi:hypothetical protein
VSFYRDVLGLEFMFAAPPSVAFFSVRGIRLMLAIPEKPEFDHPASILYFLVENIQDIHASLMQKGIIFDQAPIALHGSMTVKSGCHSFGTLIETCLHS